MSTETTVRQTFTTAEMAKVLGCTYKALGQLKAHKETPFVEGVHYRYAGLSTRSQVQWFPLETDTAFTSWIRPDWTAIETMEAE